ncbi:YecA family protein [Photobacterium sanguinicancri]|uniref:YecA family protein n=1 Tax=Photobacterium sanguinicancri TaxID=875932 RepID=UPI00247FAC88|nr:SEC-C metal-binding domain-containing protein [Photobacterium sanguinicancri]
MMTLMTLPTDWEGMPAAFIEGALLAANANPKPLEPEVWLPVLLEGDTADLGVAMSDEHKVAVLNHFELQYRHIKAGEYDLPAEVCWSEAEGVSESLAHFAEGFLSVWPHIEPAWSEQTLAGGTMNMLSALITTLMLAMNEEETLAQMEAAGINNMPAPSALYPQLKIMLTEVVMAADELQIGTGAVAVNPYKNIGRNDPCLCGSGKKFKQCCGK